MAEGHCLQQHHPHEERLSGVPEQRGQRLESRRTSGPTPHYAAIMENAVEENSASYRYKREQVPDDKVPLLRWWCLTAERSRHGSRTAALVASGRRRASAPSAIRWKVFCGVRRDAGWNWRSDYSSRYFAHHGMGSADVILVPAVLNRAAITGWYSTLPLVRRTSQTC